MKICSWNINGYRAITGQNPSKRFDKISKENKLFAYIETYKPEIICLQEIKAELNQISEDKKTPAGYISYYNTSKIKKGYSGVAVFTKIEPKSVKYGIGIEKFDNEGRILELDFEDFILMNVYFPNGTSGYDRVEFKLEFYDALFDYIEQFRKKGRKFIVSGDYNTAHKEIDLARPKENENNSGFLPEEREKIDKIVALGYVDTFRMFCSEGGHYTWWSQRGRARERNVGWRIDYHFVTTDLTKFVKNSIIQPHIEGSDHCPIILEINL